MNLELDERPTGIHMYRYDSPMFDGEGPMCWVYLVAKETKAGYWVVPEYNWRSKAKFVLKDRHDGKGKRHCYTTKEMALQSFLHRKKKQIYYASHTVRRAKKDLAAGNKLAEQMGVAKVNAPDILTPCDLELNPINF